MAQKAEFAEPELGTAYPQFLMTQLKCPSYIWFMNHFCGIFDIDIHHWSKIQQTKASISTRLTIQSVYISTIVML